MIYELIKLRAEQCPQRVALRCGAESVTYLGLLKLVDERVEQLRARGIDVVVEPLATNVDGVVTLLACAAVGATLLPMPATATKQQVTDTFHVTFFNGAVMPSPRPYLLLSSSGTTGTPKLLMLTQETKLLRADQLISTYGVTATDVVLVGSALHLSLPIRLVLVTLLLGATAVLVERYSEQAWAAAAAQCSVVVGTPHQLRHLQAGPRLRLVLSASASRPAHDPLTAELAAARVPYHECYGTSEVAIAATRQVLPGAERMYRSLPNVRLLQAPNGELLVTSPCLFSGYWQHQAATQAALSNGAFRTGDVVHYSTVRPHLFRLLGRTDDRIRVGAHTVWPERVEAVLRTMFCVQDCAVVGTPSKLLGEVVKAYVVADHDLTLREVQRHCLATLPDEAVPRALELVDAIPYGENGKLLRRKLR